MPDAQPPATPPAKRRWLRRTLIVGQVLLGLGLGLGIAEWAFARRDDGAFAHVNFYVADPELGVRLQPGASMRFRLHDNPVSEIHVNSRGYRGADWPEGLARDQILVVGDSQVFGLGVDDDETFSARLAELTGRTVINAGVPTYGPLEYLAVTEELLAERDPAIVIYVINFLNDPFELERPNRERHAVWDGWAVRSETAPASVLEFPGRRSLFSRSHLVYAARRWLYELDDDAAREQLDRLDRGLPSEGTWEDLIADGVRSREHAERELSDADAATLRRHQRIEAIRRDLVANDAAIVEVLLDEFDSWGRVETQIIKAQPGDIVVDEDAESSRSITVTAEAIQEATRARQDFVRAHLRRSDLADDPALRSLLARNSELIDAQLELRDELGAEELLRLPSVFEPHLREVARLCDRSGAELIVVALPIDVQVSADEWAKYGVEEPPDMQPSLALLADLIASAEAVGARTLDATAALRAAEPGAFLNGDIHMTAKGHAALAEALIPVLEWTLPPPPDSYVVVRGDTLSTIAKRFGCTTKQLARHNDVDPSKTLYPGVELDLSRCRSRR